jgi:ABC-type sugar transport system ATPase subunit
MSTITLEHLHKSFPNGFVAARDLELEIEDGELLVLVGPSGSGKTTVLRMIAGLETPTSGVIRIGERDVTMLPPQERDVAMVFQSYALYPHMTVRENMAFGLRIRKHASAVIEQRVRAVADSLGLASLLDRKPAQLSGGQRQRVALGRAIVREPVAFLFDEPLSNLDARLRVETRAELARLHRRLGATMVYVTHDQTEAMTLGDRVAVLRDGELQQVAPPRELYRDPANRFVAGFIGSPAMNFIEGTLGGENGDRAFHSEVLTLPLDGDVALARGAPVALGVRAQHVELGAAERTGPAIVRATVALVESLGSEQIVHLATPSGARLMAVTPPDVLLAVDDAVTARIPPDRVYLFEEPSGVRLKRRESVTH